MPETIYGFGQEKAKVLSHLANDKLLGKQHTGQVPNQPDEHTNGELWMGLTYDEIPRATVDGYDYDSYTTSNGERIPQTLLDRSRRSSGILAGRGRIYVANFHSNQDSNLSYDGLPIHGDDDDPRCRMSFSTTDNNDIHPPDDINGFFYYAFNFSLDHIIKRFHIVMGIWMTGRRIITNDIDSANIQRFTHLGIENIPGYVEDLGFSNTQVLVHKYQQFTTPTASFGNKNHGFDSLAWEDYDPHSH